MNFELKAKWTLITGLRVGSVRPQRAFGARRVHRFKQVAAETSYVRFVRPAPRSSSVQSTLSRRTENARLLQMDVKVKICGITSVADGLAATEAGADLIGLMFYDKSPRHIPLATAAEISRALPPFVMRVGVFVDPEPELVVRTIGECGLSLLQFHGDETPEFCTQFGMMSMKAFRIRDAASLAALPDYPTDAYLLDAYSASGLGGTGEKFNWDLAVEAKTFGKPVFLAGGLTPENVAQAVKQVHPFAVDVSSGVESSPGKKEAAKIRAFIQAVRSVEES